jgi:protein phosphatase
MIRIIEQGYLSEIGKRSNNEDNFALIEGSTFIVCDGVGGSEKGEIASEMVSKYFIKAYQDDPQADANYVLKVVESQLSNFTEKNPDALGMATTLTFSQVREEGLYIAWVGDSRIYQFRNGQIVFKTSDHSWVNDALKAGIITLEESINHPKSNIITRAIQGSHKPTNADTLLLTDIKKGDLFFHCSDGVLEAWNDDDLQALFFKYSNSADILEVLKKECEIHSKDNFTAIVYKIEEVSLKPVKKDDSFVNSIPIHQNEYYSQTSNPKSSITRKLFGIPLYYYILLFLLLTGIAYFFVKKDDSKPEKPKKVQPEKTKTIIATQIAKSSDTIGVEQALENAGWKISDPRDS